MALHTRSKISLVLLAAAMVAAIAGLWRYREPIARDALDSYFAQHGVKASYKIKAIETRRQRLEDVRIGNPARPDLIADWIEIDVGPSLTGVSVKAFRAGGLRLWGQQQGEKISFGSLDRLIPKASDGVIRLPRVDLALEDIRLGLESPYGHIGLRIDGQGNLRSGFEGKLALVSPQLRMGRCRATDVRAYGDVSVVGARPTYTGPLRFSGLNCGAVASSAGTVTLDASLSEDARNWRGSGRVMLDKVVATGVRISRLTGGGEFSGDILKSDARFELQGQDVTAEHMRAAQVRMAAKAVFGMRGVTVTGRGAGFGIGGGAPIGAIVQAITGLRQTAVIGPLAQQFAQALARAETRLKAEAGFNWALVDGQSEMSLGNIRLSSPGRGFAVWSDKDAIAYDASGLRLNGAARFGGGGFPAGRAQFAGRSGQIIFAPYRAKDAEMRMTPIAFLLTAKGIGLETQMTLDGPLANGRVKGLRFPLRLSPGQMVPQGCFPLRLQAIAAGSVRLGPARMQACSNTNGLRLIAPRFGGRLDGLPLRLTAADARLDFNAKRAAIQALALNWGQGGDGSHLQIEQITGKPLRGGFGGRVTGLEGHLAGIPLAVEQLSGDWTSARSVVNLAATALVADRTAAPRFMPLRAANIQARLARGIVTATTQMREPESGRDVANISLRHVIGASQGAAQIEVPALLFGPGLQPEALTPVTKGVVANVLGGISGSGRIAWSQGQVRSSGSFQSSGLDFAAAFGPVRGLAGEIHFSDLIGLVTDGVQEARVAAINPGVEVTAGLVRYRILPDFKVAIEGARWPFAGGALVLEPTLLDMAESAQRRLTFRAEGLDAARFIAAMEFENIAATGVYDGVLPMVFDNQGGRIEGGHLVARGGGTVSYVGPVSNENLGLMGRFAFDALKSMRYSRLGIDLNGAIDGDVITRVSFAGVNQAPVAGGRTKLPIKILGASNIPFIFNVTITAKFRQLFEMARSVNDPSVFINRAYPKVQADPVLPNKRDKPVQPSDRPDKR